MSRKAASHYEILRVSIDCNFKELKKAYFKRAKECHLYRFFLARTCVAAGRYREAIKQYRLAIEIGKTRIPMQRLERFHAELATIRKKKNPWWYGVTAIFAKERPRNLFAETEAGMIEEANRSIARILRDQNQKKKRLT